MKLSKDEFETADYSNLDPTIECSAKTKEQILKNQESIEHIREWVDIMKDEPEEYIKLSEVYHSLRRMLGDEE